MDHIDYLALKNTHISLVTISFVLFNFRALLSICSHYHPSFLFRIVVHAVDTLLLICGVTLAWMLALNPIEVSWLGVKIIGLVVYIALASFAVKYAKTQRSGIYGYILSQLVFGYIVLVALNKSVFPFLS